MASSIDIFCRSNKNSIYIVVWPLGDLLLALHGRRLERTGRLHEGLMERTVGGVGEAIVYGLEGKMRGQEVGGRLGEVICYFTVFSAAYA